MVINATVVELNRQRGTVIANGAYGRGINRNQCCVIAHNLTVFIQTPFRAFYECFICVRWPP